MSIQRLRFILDSSLSTTNYLERSIERYGNRTVLHFAEPVHLNLSHSEMTTAELIGAVNRCSNALMQVGLRRYARVAICKENSPDYFVYGNAIIRAGGVAVPISGGMQAEVLIAYLNNVGACILITDGKRLDELEAAGFRERCPALATVFLVDGSRPDCLSMPAALAAAGTSFEPVRICADEDILIVHTSGTTGIPKGVLHTDRSFVAGLKGMLKIGGLMLSRRARVLGIMPYNHYIAYQTIASALVAGNCGMLISAPKAPQVLNLIERYRPAAIFSFPHIYVDMCEHGLRGHDLGSVKMWMAGADSSHEAHIRELVQHGAYLRLFGKTLVPSLYIDTLGTSEVGFPAFRRISTKHSTLFGRCIGRPMSAGPRVKVADEDGRMLEPMKIGRLMVKGPTLFKGYWNGHDRSHGVVKDGWWWTGDIGYRDSKGRYFHLDRDVDVVYTACGPLSTLLLEEHILKHPDVAEAIVVARHLTDGSSVPHVFVQVRRDAKVDLEDLVAWCRKGLSENFSSIAGHLQVQLTQAGQIPRGLTGKVLKRELRDRLEHA